MIAALHSTVEPTDQVLATEQSIALAEYAARYEWLRSRNLDSLQQGGVFAGKTPDNVVLNGARSGRGHRRGTPPVLILMDHLAPVIDTDLLPPLLQDFVRLIGLEATLAMVRAYGGLRIFIPTPARCTADHPFAQLIGLDKLLILAGEYGAVEHFTLPKAQRAILAVRDARIAHAYATTRPPANWPPNSTSTSAISSASWLRPASPRPRIGGRQRCF